MSEPVPVKDPVCGKDVDPLRARAVGIFGGVTYYFCSADCKTRFRDPRKTPREPTRDVATKGAASRQSPAVAAEKNAENNAEKSGDAKTKAKAAAATAAAAAKAAAATASASEAVDRGPVAVDKPWAKKPKPQDESSPSPSVEEDLRALQPASSRAWLVALVLCALAGGVLFFALHR